MLFAILFSAMASILHLPSEVLSHILKYTDISVEDVANLSLTCKQLQLLICDEQLWRNKFFRRWPSLKNICEIKWEKSNVNVKTEALRRLACRSKLLNYIEYLYERYHDRDDLTCKDMKEFNVMFHNKKGAHFMNVYYLEDELLNIIRLNPTDENTNLRMVYYSAIILLYMKYYRLKEKLEEFKNLPSRLQILEKTFAMFLQNCQFKKCIYIATVMSMLDSLVNEVSTHLKNTFPDHSLFQLSTTQLLFWKYNNIDNSYWDYNEAWAILQSIASVVSEKMLQLEFDDNNNVDNIFHFLKDHFGGTVRLDICFVVIFHAVARRLGLRCDIKYNRYETHCFLIWKANYNSCNLGRCCRIEIDDIIDKFNLSIEDNYIADSLDEDMGTPSLVMNILYDDTIMASHLHYHYITIHTKYLYVKIVSLISSSVTISILDYAHYVEHFNMDFTELIDILNEELRRSNITKRETSQIRALLEKFTQPKPQEPIIIHKRTKDVKYAIGMIVESVITKNAVEGVICGWDVHFGENRKFLNLNQGKVNSMNRFPTFFENYNQPYYKILMANWNCTMYIPQSMVRPLKDNIKSILNSEVGRYFCYFKKTHYIPNRILEEEYPYDATVRDCWLRSLVLHDQQTDMGHSSQQNI